MKSTRTTSIKSSFQFIQVIVILLLAFLAIESTVLWRVCRQGTQRSKMRACRVCAA